MQPDTYSLKRLVERRAAPAGPFGAVLETLRLLVVMGRPREEIESRLEQYARQAHPHPETSIAYQMARQAVEDLFEETENHPRRDEA